jgi:hypothetical protein
MLGQDGERAEYERGCSGLVHARCGPGAIGQHPCRYQTAASQSLMNNSGQRGKLHRDEVRPRLVSPSCRSTTMK